MTTAQKSIVWRGEWSAVIAWLDDLAGGRFWIPFGRRPPIYREDDELVVENRSGVERCPIGGEVYLDADTGELHVR